MPKSNWLKEEFSYGYSSGNILSLIPNFDRIREEKKIGGSYREVFFKAIRPFLTSSSRVLELGPRKGSWSRAILKYIPHGILHTIDFQDVTSWIDPKLYSGRLICHKVSDYSYEAIPNTYFDFFWSMGVMCHNNLTDIEKILTSSLPKMKPGSYAVHQYSDWNKLENYGWKRGQIPEEFKLMEDDLIWWPRNNQVTMSEIASKVGWEVINSDLNLVKRDSIILLRAPL